MIEVAGLDQFAASDQSRARRWALAYGQAQARGLAKHLTETDRVRLDAYLSAAREQEQALSPK